MRIIVKTSLILMFLTSIMFVAVAQEKDMLMGKWLTAAGDMQVQIVQASGKFSGRIVWLKDPNDEKGKPLLDDKNPDQSLNRRPLMGTEVLKGFNYTEDGVWEGGTIYDPKTGKTYSCTISLMSRDKINVRGFVGISLLGRTETWSRVK